MKQGIKLVAFDLDGTLTHGYSWTLFHTVAGVSTQKQHEWRSSYFSQKLSYSEWIRLIETKYRASGKTKADFLSTVNTIPFKKGARRIIRTLMSHYPIHIVSSSIDIYVEAVARQLGVTEFHANHTLVFDSQDKFESITYQAPEAEAKVVYLTDLCDQLRLKPHEICFVGDSLGDLPAFSFTKRGILVGNGEPELHKAAWKQVKTLDQILSLLL